MDKRTFVGLCAALAFVAGSPGAHALKISDTLPGDRATLMAGMDSFTYASETLLTTEVTEAKGDDSTKYYNIGGTGYLVLSAPADVGATGSDVYLVTVTLDGMVFRTEPVLSPNYPIVAGGAVGDKMVVFRKTDTTALPAASGILGLTARFAVSEGGGSATLTMTNQTLAGLDIPGVSGTATHSGNVVKVASALEETPMVKNLTASVGTSFKKFKKDAPHDGRRDRDRWQRWIHSG